MWEYYNVYTCAQLELIALDAPVVVYNKDKGKKKKGEKAEFKKADAVDVLLKADAWNRKYADKKPEEGIKLNFSDFK